MSGRKVLIFLSMVVLALLTYRLWLAEDGYREVRRLEQEILEQRAEVDDKQLRNRKLDAEVKDLKDGVDAVEERARSELGMTKKDETFVQIIEDPDAAESPDPE